MIKIMSSTNNVFNQKFIISIEEIVTLEDYLCRMLNKLEIQLNFHESNMKNM